MTAPDDFCDTCPVCAGKVRDAQAAAGLRCKRCLGDFDKPYPFRSDTSPDFCFGCERIVNSPKDPRVGMYGSGRNAL